MLAPSRRFVFALPSYLLLLLAPSAFGQFGNEWLTFERSNDRLIAAPELLLEDEQEKSYAWADLDKDGWTDLVVARKQPGSSQGRFPNLLLMNERGTLVDRTISLASSSDVAGDQGFLTPTNDRAVVIADVDGDGWPDVITATGWTEGQPKEISHPRVYRNLGASPGGTWLGLHHEDARIPLLLLEGTPIPPRFTFVSVGDVNADGAPDLYFVHQDINAQPGLEDRLLINDGGGFFVDESALRMTPTMLNSTDGSSSAIADLNGDGVPDIMKSAGTNAVIRLNYNDPSDPGFFQTTSEAPATAPYHVSVQDLNNDDRLDLVVSDDGLDHILYNLETDANDLVVWSPPIPFEFLSGGDDGFAGDSLAVDLDLDGWRDVIITDHDLNIASCSRRTHIYHNLGGAPGDLLAPVEEAQQAGSSGWKGAVGLLVGDLRGSHDVAVFDIDNDGDPDMILGRCTGTDLWLNQLPPAEIGTPYCAATLNSTGAAAVLRATGSVSVSDENITLEASQLPPSQPGVFFVGEDQIQTPFGDGFLCTLEGLLRLGLPVFADNTGAAQSAIDWNLFGPSLPPGTTRYFQLWYRDSAAGATGSNLTQGLAISLQP